MADLRNTAPPSLPFAPDEYSRPYQDQLNTILRLYFSLLSSPQNFAVLGLNFDIDRMPTQADLATLRSGDVYRDTSAGNVLKVKV
jgi:hypothetical protein